MRYLVQTLLAGFAMTLMPTAAKADLAPPVPPVKEVKFVVEVDEKAKAPKLIVPQNLTTVRFRPGGPKNQPGGKEPLVMELESDDEVTPEPGPNHKHLMIAGVALTLSLGLGGLWLVRRNGRSSVRGLALLIAAGTTLSASTLVWANAPAPPPPPKKERVVLPVAFDGKVNLEVVVGGDTIRLVLDKETYEKMKKGADK